MNTFIAQLAIKDSHDFFDKLLTEIHIWELVLDLSGTIKTWKLVYANPPALKTWGVDSLATIQGKTTDEIFGHGATEHYLPVIEKLFKTRNPHHFTDYFEHLDKYFNFTSIPYDDYFVTTGDDVTELVKERNEFKKQNKQLIATSHALEKSKFRMKIATEAAGVGIWDLNLDKNELVWDEQMYRLYGVVKDDFSGAFEAWSKGLYPADRSRAEQAFDTAVIGDGQFHEEFRVQQPSGEIKWIKADAWTRVDESDGCRHMIGVNQDITKQKESEKQLKKRQQLLEEAKVKAEQANRIKSDFLAAMSHELRTPMTTVLGYTDLMLDDKKLSHSIRENCEKIKYATSSLLQIINEILDLSKLEARKLKLVNERFDFINLMQEIVAVFDKTNKTARLVQWDLIIDDDIPRNLWADPSKLKQVLFNLLGNAQKFTEEGRIAIKCERLLAHRDKPKVKISVTDTGIGLNCENIERLFEPFVQADSTRSRKFAGTGLGLPISKQIVELMGGGIEAQCREEKGAVFSFTFPLIEADIERETQKKGLSLNDFIAVRSLRILLAEDNQVNQMLANKVLVKLGHQVSLANNGRQAIELFRANDYDLILMDIRMPEVDGIEATREIRHLENNNTRIPVIAVTADLVAEHLDHFIQSGVDVCAPKPFDWPDLLMKMNDLVGEKVHIRHES